MELKCSSCGIGLVGQENFVQFKCPSCGEVSVIRCKQCKTLSIKYKCEKCGFEGP
jgi:Zn-ribbon RNA-binding protein